MALAEQLPSACVHLARATHTPIDFFYRATMRDLKRIHDTLNDN
jgi:hypothetical protein